MSGANETDLRTDGASEPASEHAQHVLTLFGKAYPTDSANLTEGFPGQYYKSTVDLIRTWYAEQWMQKQNTATALLKKKNYTRPAPYDAWNAVTLGRIGVTDFIHNLARHMDKLFSATAKLRGKQYDNVRLAGFIRSFNLVRNHRPVNSGITEAEHEAVLNKAISEFSERCSERCTELKILQCQVVDAILVNALAAVVTMQKGHIKMNEQLLIDSDPNCPILVSYTGSFHQDSAVQASNAENPAIILGPANNLVNEQYEEQYEEHRRSKVQRLF